MKCNNCGVNFDDEDRVCPMCGTPAGAGKKRYMPHYTEYGHTDHTDGSCTHRTCTQKYTSKQPARSASSGAGQRKNSSKNVLVIVVVIVLGMLLSVIPEVLQEMRQAVEQVGWSAQGGTPEPEPESDYYDYEANRVVPAEVLGEYQAVDTGLGDFILMLDDEDNYIFAFEGDGWRYDESGWAWCVYNPPEQELYQDIYTPDQYDSYTLCLDFEQAGDVGGTQPETIAAHIEQGEMWMLVYVSQTDGSIVLDDAYGDAGVFFGGNQFLPLQSIQKG